MKILDIDNYSISELEELKNLCEHKIINKKTNNLQEYVTNVLKMEGFKNTWSNGYAYHAEYGETYLSFCDQGERVMGFMTDIINKEVVDHYSVEHEKIHIRSNLRFAIPEIIINTKCWLKS